MSRLFYSVPVSRFERPPVGYRARFLWPCGRVSTDICTLLQYSRPGFLAFFRLPSWCFHRGFSPYSAVSVAYRARFRALSDQPRFSLEAIYVGLAGFVPALVTSLGYLTRFHAMSEQTASFFVFLGSGPTLSVPPPPLCSPFNPVVVPGAVFPCPATFVRYRVRFRRGLDRLLPGLKVCRWTFTALDCVRCPARLCLRYLSCLFQISRFWYRARFGGMVRTSSISVRTPRLDTPSALSAFLYATVPVCMMIFFPESVPSVRGTGSVPKTDIGTLGTALHTSPYFAIPVL